MNQRDLENALDKCLELSDDELEELEQLLQTATSVRKVGQVKPPAGAKERFVSRLQGACQVGLPQAA